MVWSKTISNKERIVYTEQFKRIELEIRECKGIDGSDTPQTCRYNSKNGI